MKYITRVFLVVVFAAGLTAAGEPEHHGPPPPDDARFEFLRNLEGTWVTEPKGDGTPAGTIEFRVTAGGHAVEEREFAGTPMEMLTVYNMDGEDLVATHYCIVGNQPRATATSRVVDHTLKFDCSGTPGNAKSHDDAHIHGWSINLEDGRLHYSAEMVESGTVIEKPDFVLTRQTKTASR